MTRTADDRHFVGGTLLTKNLDRNRFLVNEKCEEC